MLPQKFSHNYKLIISYDGTNYSGWQVQPNGISIQELIEKSLRTIVRHEVKVVGSGRTDAGVHAFGQTAHFKTEGEIDCYRVLRSLNGLLPQDIRILTLEPVPLEFHAQYSAKSKEYHYHLFLDPYLDPFKRRTCWHIRGPFNRRLLREGASFFVGKHDFTTFANEAHSGVAAHDPVRTLKRLDVIDEVSGVRLEFEADGFLYKMVRNITGTLVEVALGKRAPESIPLLLEVKDRRSAGIAAPPQGLFLVKVNYEECL